MAEGRQVQHHGEAIVLRTWPFHEADLLVSLFTREQGKVKGVARHAMKSRRRFGGALEPATQVRAHYTERPRQELVRMDQFEILWSPLAAPVDWLRAAALQLVVEVLEEGMPEGATDDNIYRLAVTCLTAIQSGEPTFQDRNVAHPSSEVAGTAGLSAPVEMTEFGKGVGVWLPVTYFCLWMDRLMGWMPELGHCVVCGLDLRGQDVWWSPTADGVTCHDDRRPGSRVLRAASVAESYRMARTPLGELAAEEWPHERGEDLRGFAIGVLERHLERRLRSAVGLA